jgi:hypothetical protein
MKTHLKRIGMTGMIALTMAACAAPSEEARAQNPGLCNSTMVKMAEASTLPKLHEIQSKVFAAPYSCKSMSYERSALFLSSYSKERNMPDLLFNGACGSQLYVEASTAGDDISMIADLGDVPLEQVTKSKAINWTRIVGGDNSFKDSQALIEGHTYVVVISKSELRAVFAFKVFGLYPNGSMGIHYAVKSYELQQTANASKGSNWEQGNQEYKGRY